MSAWCRQNGWMIVYPLVGVVFTLVIFVSVFLLALWLVPQ